MITLLKSDINEREIAHVINYFDLKQNETDSIWNLVNEVKEILDLKYNPQGYNIGFNVGTLCTKKCT